MFPEVLLIYFIAITIAAACVGGYFLVRHFFKGNEKAESLFLKFLGGTAISVVLVCIFSIKGAMITTNAGGGYFNESVGNVFLVGVPYGNYKFLNLLAWLSNTLILPVAFITPLIIFFPSKTTKLINKYILFPIISLEFIFLFNLLNAMTGNTNLGWENILLAIETAVLFSVSGILFFKDLKEVKFANWKEIVRALIFYFTVLLFSLPVNTPSTLFDHKASFLGAGGYTLKVLDFTMIHRIWLVVGLLLPVFMYFANRDDDMNAKKVITLATSLGALSVFFTSYGLLDIFSINDANMLVVNVRNLPLHLCHTALFVVPICIAFNLKKLFYFTYFINVFGALVAMLMPNVGGGINYLSPDVILFWYNHIAAFGMPLLCVALGIFEKPKMKQMFYSLMFFAAYMISIVFLNAWLSNYVNGYVPGQAGSGTDYLFVNGTFILDKLGKEAFHMLDYKLEWVWGDCHFIIYPLYQSIFLIGYTAIAFAMWFIYSLFFKIADSHKELHIQLIVARKHNLNLKEMLKMSKVDNETIKNSEALLKFTNFSKRYGNSSKLSADNVNLEVRGGEIFGFLGPNGAGKSTCIKTTIGIQPVTDGTIEVCGFDVSKNPVEAKKLIGYVPDHYALYEKLTGREYINYIADLYGVSQEDRDQRINLYVSIFELNQAFDNRMQTYSHGMKQKMTIMAALVHNPKVWILDEPLTGLDPQSIYQVKEVMKAHAKAGNIVFFSSHIINVVEKLCTRIAIIRKGHIVFEDSMENVIKDHPEGLEEFYMQTIRDNGDFDE